MTEPARIAAPPPGGYDWTAETVIIGAGACGLVAALAAAERGEEVVVLERDPVPRGSTALSAGLVPAAGTRWQHDAGIDDDPACFAADIQAKAHGENRPEIVDLLATAAAPTLEWLADAHGLAFSLVHDVDYPGHSRRRMHGLPARSGAELVDALRAAVERAGPHLVTEARVATLHAEAGGHVSGLEAIRPDGSRERLGCKRLILACNGFGANAGRRARHIPDIAGALYFGHPGNCGDALDWGEALGAATRHLGAYQGHGNVAHPHGILITWAVIGAGGFQVDLTGQRFWNEAQGYSEAARAVLARPEGQAIAVFDARGAAIARQFADFRDAEAQGAIKAAASPAELARAFALPEDAFVATCAEVAGACATGMPDRFGRRFTPSQALAAPLYGVRVTGALFHTQGGLEIDRQARVLRATGGSFPNLFAAGGAACGVSGAGDAGYLSGNGLLAAVTLGRIAGAAPG